jgi:hypothetical protein
MKHATRSITQGLGDAVPARAGRPPARPNLRCVGDTATITIAEERVFGSPQFIRRGRNPNLESPARFEPTTKNDGDVVL